MSIAWDLRIRAIFCCLYFGTMPWRVYEKECHYEGVSYLSHLWMNLETAWHWVWLTDEITQEYIDFEKEVNPSWSGTLNNLFAGLA